MPDIRQKALRFISLVSTLSLSLLAPTRVSAADPESVFGTVEEPPGVREYNITAGGNGLGLIVFISAGIRIITIVAGLYVFLNLITAGYDYISAGDSKAHQAVKDKVTMSVLGLAIIVASYTIIALLSYLFFGDPAYILNPTISGPIAG
jgi:hypothetical protein